ncbi:MAG: efflux RND transporter periplasmic adaptor subunit [bacterium]|nr:efflux RND transporter periplasmic adaptor subunit [bacterium]
MNNNFIIKMQIIFFIFLAVFSINHNLIAEEEHEHELHENEEEIVTLSDEQIREFGIVLDTAKPGEIEKQITLPGEIQVNADKLTHITPRISGIVIEVRKNLGDKVAKGEVIAVIESRELADAKAEYLSNMERLALAENNFLREESLREKEISSEKEYFDAKQLYAEAKINFRSSTQKLLALGFSKDYLQGLPNQDDISFTRYEITAPIEGTIIDKHISLGEKVSTETEILTIVDLSELWVDISVYPADLPFIELGDTVIIKVEYDGIGDIKSTITYLSPSVGEKTRTSIARAVVSNNDNKLKPGMFIKAIITISVEKVGLLVPKSALTYINNDTIIFVKDENGFHPESVVTGKENINHTEILSGLSAGQIYVEKGGFILKSELEKEKFGGDGHGH